MKQLTNYQRVCNYLVKIFRAVNEEYFYNELEVPTITIQSTVGAYGHISVQKIWHSNEVATHELNLSADYLNRPIENIVATLSITLKILPIGVFTITKTLRRRRSSWDIFILSVMKNMVGQSQARLKIH